MRFGSRGANEFFSPAVSDTSPRCFEREGLGRHLTGTNQFWFYCWNVKWNMNSARLNSTHITYKNSLRDGRWKGVGSLGEGYLGEFLLDVCRWPLRTPATFVYAVGNYRPHLCHLWANVIFVTPTLLLSLTFLNPLLTRIFYWKCNPIIVNPVVKMRPHPAAHPH